LPAAGSSRLFAFEGEDNNPSNGDEYDYQQHSQDEKDNDLDRTGDAFKITERHRFTPARESGFDTISLKTCEAVRVGVFHGDHSGFAFAADL